MLHIYLPLLYIDPTSGSLFIQAVIAAIVVVPFFLRSQIRQAVGKVRGSSRAPAAAPVAGDTRTSTGSDLPTDQDLGAGRG